MGHSVTEESGDAQYLSGSFYWEPALRMPLRRSDGRDWCFRVSNSLRFIYAEQKS